MGQLKNRVESVEEKTNCFESLEPTAASPLNDLREFNNRSESVEETYRIC